MKLYDAIVLADEYMDEEEWNNFWKVLKEYDTHFEEMKSFVSKPKDFDYEKVHGYMSKELSQLIRTNKEAKKDWEKAIQFIQLNCYSNNEREFEFKIGNNMYRFIVCMNSPYEYMLADIKGVNDFITDYDFDDLVFNYEEKRYQKNTLNARQCVHNVLDRYFEYKIYAIPRKVFNKAIDIAKKSYRYNKQAIEEDNLFLNELQLEGLSETEVQEEKEKAVQSSVEDEVAEYFDDVMPFEWMVGKKIGDFA